MTVAAMESVLSRIGRAAAGRWLAAGWADVAAKAVASLLLLVGLDALQPLTMWARTVLAATWMAAVLTGLVLTFWRARRHAPSVLAVARLIEQRAAVPHNRIVNALQLGRASSPDLGGDHVSRALAERTLAKGSEGLASVAVGSALARESRLMHRAVWWLALAAGVFVGAAGLMPRVIGSGLPRFADPLGDHPPWSPTRFRIWCEPVEPTFGDDVQVRVETSGLLPPALRLVVGSAPTLEPNSNPMQAVAAGKDDEVRTFTARLRDVRRSLRVYAEGDTGRSASIIITPNETPRIVEATLRATPPAYTRRPETVRPMQSGGSLECVEGTRLNLRVTGTMGLQPAGVEVSPSPGEVPRLSVRGRTLSAEWIAAMAGSYEVRATPVGESGVPARQSTQAIIGVVTDQPPSLRLISPEWSGEELLAPAGATLEFRAESGDDFGLSVLGLAWWRLDARGVWVGDGRFMRARHDGPSITTNLDDTVAMSPRLVLPAIGAQPGETLVISLLAQDSRVRPFGEPQRAIVGPIVVHLAPAEPSGSCSGKCDSWIKIPSNAADASSEEGDASRTWSSEAPPSEPGSREGERSPDSGGSGDPRWPSPSQQAGRDAGNLEHDDREEPSRGGESDRPVGESDLVDAPPAMGADMPSRARAGGERAGGRMASEATRSDDDPLLRVPPGYRDVVTRYFILVNRAPAEPAEKERSP